MEIVIQQAANGFIVTFGDETNVFNTLNELIAFIVEIYKDAE